LYCIDGSLGIKADGVTMFHLLFVYVVISLVCSLGWIEQHVAKKGSQQFPPLLIANSFPTVLGVYSVCANHMFSVMQCIIPSFSLRRKSFVHLCGALVELLPPIAGAVSVHSVVVLSIISSGLRLDSRGGTNLCMCVCFYLPSFCRQRALDDHS
jgi:hypothetical protein